MRAPFVHLALVAVLVLTACGSTKRQPPLLGSPSELLQRASRIGCASVDPDFFGKDAFSCIKTLAPCGCTLLLKVDTTSDASPRVNLVRIDVIGCRAGEANNAVADLLDPFVSRTARALLRDFITRPHLARTEEEEARLAVLQQATFGSVAVRVQFGAQSARNAGAGRRTIWVDPAASGSREELVPDVPASASCVSASQPGEQGQGYCDTAPQGVEPCDLDPAKRKRYRQRVALVASRSLAAWREAIRTLLGEGRVARTSAPPEQLAEALAGVLPRPSRAEVTISKGSTKPGITALQLAAETASDWHERLTGNLESLFDADLAALMLALPAPEEVSANVFAERIRHRLDELSGKQSTSSE